MDILVTGAAGYIGSIITEQLVDNGYHVIALDNLQQGHHDAVHPDATFIEADFSNTEVLNNIFNEFDIRIVVHMAAETVIELSITDPKKFFLNNVSAGLNLLNAMLRHHVDKIVFSSSAAIYGESKYALLHENDNHKPMNAYGDSKLMFERILAWYGSAYKLNSISFRFFNAGGASQRFGEDHDPETHLIPNVLKIALKKTGYVSLFGTDYDTPDGSCIRDYIHVLDISQAHLTAIKHLQENTGCRVYNLGNGHGYSVFQVVETARKVTGAEIPAKILPKRVGDPAILVASPQLAKKELGWKPLYDKLDKIIETAWDWHIRNPQGYVK